MYVLYKYVHTGRYVYTYNTYKYNMYVLYSTVHTFTLHTTWQYVQTEERIFDMERNLPPFWPSLPWISYHFPNQKMRRRCPMPAASTILKMIRNFRLIGVKYSITEPPHHFRLLICGMFYLIVDPDRTTVFFNFHLRWFRWNCSACFRFVLVQHDWLI